MGGRNRYPGSDVYAVNLVRMKSRQLCRQPGFSQEDQPDIEQELMMELAQRLPTYDPAKASLEAFTTWIVLQKIADLVKAHRTKKRCPAMKTVSLNDLVFTRESDSLEEERWATIDSEVFQRFLDSGCRSAEERLGLGIDLELAMANLPKELRHLCELLAKYNIVEVARKLGVARSSLYRSIHALREVFEKAGLRDYL